MCAFIVFKEPWALDLRTGCTVVDFKMGPDARKPDFGACKQQRRRPVFLSTQSDQRLYCSLIGKFNGLSLTQKPTRQVSPEMALMYLTTYLNQKTLFRRQVYGM